MGFHQRGCDLVFILSILLILSSSAGMVSSRASGVHLTNNGGCWHIVSSMSITVQLDLSEAVAAEAKAKGLLQPQNLRRLIEREVKAESARGDFFEMVRDLRALPGEPMSMEKIQAEVDAVRAEV
jgi:hypothetical protein